MLKERSRDWTQNWKQEGRQEGESVMLTRQLERRFGPLDESVRQRVAAANAETLLEWADRVLTARSVEEVLE